MTLHKLDINNNSADLVEYLVAEFGCATLRARTVAADLHAIGLALRGGLITPLQAMMHLDETDALCFLGRLPGENWAPKRAESARQYHRDR